MVRCKKHPPLSHACPHEGVFSMTVITAHMVFITASGGFA
jgi:metal-dependent amidase/aminoacylase/carboxypeptidase family protein